jgi:UDP-3-O-[3-hydroxymyristoyl] glucosamine N-acyltransferase
MNFTAQQIAELVGGAVEGDPFATVTKLARIEDATAGALSFLHAPKYFQFLTTAAASVVLVPEDFVAEHPYTATLVRVQNPYAAFGMFLHMVYRQQEQRSGQEQPHHIAPTATVAENIYIGAFAYVDEGAKIGYNVRLYPNVYIGRNVVIGDNCTLYPNAVVYHNCVLGSGCIVHSGAIIGSDGFGFLQNEQHENIKVPQLGNVVLEDDVEVGANTCIDRATLGSTIIRSGVKLDNLVQVAHNVEIGANSVMAAQSGISGSSKLGRSTMIGGQVGVAGHLSLADFTQVGAQSGISKSVQKPGTALRGSPAQPIKDQLKHEATLRQVPHLLERLEQLEEKLALLQANIQPTVHSAT